jgi:hypothetical protein
MRGSRRQVPSVQYRDVSEVLDPWSRGRDSSWLDQLNPLKTIARTLARSEPERDGGRAGDLGAQLSERSDSLSLVSTPRLAMNRATPAWERGVRLKFHYTQPDFAELILAEQTYSVSQ